VCCHAVEEAAQFERAHAEAARFEQAEAARFEQARFVFNKSSNTSKYKMKWAKIEDSNVFK